VERKVERPDMVSQMRFGFGAVIGEPMSLILKQHARYLEPSSRAPRWPVDEPR